MTDIDFSGEETCLPFLSCTQLNFDCNLVLRRSPAKGYQVATSPCVTANVNDLCYRRLTSQNQKSTKCTAYREPAGKELWPKWCAELFVPISIDFNINFKFQNIYIIILYQRWFHLHVPCVSNRSRFLGWTHVCPARAVKSMAAGLSQLNETKKNALNGTNRPIGPNDQRVFEEFLAVKIYGFDRFWYLE